MGDIKLESKQIAKAAAVAFGGVPQVHRYWDDSELNNIDILSCSDSPWAGVIAYSTIGVSEMPLRKDGKELSVRSEIVGACGSQFPEFPNFLATAALFVKKSGLLVAPGVIFPNVLDQYCDSSLMRHLLFLPPFLWEQRLSPLQLDEKIVTWLLAIPIAEAELEFAVKNGVPSLEQLFEKEQIDIFDLNRLSVV
ncbi:MAG: suppressor of fused domain protein [Fibrobacteres bacterium]|nr:suppressor of fused domain protein [Fibrobacterota bacterium]